MGKILRNSSRVTCLDNMPSPWLLISNLRLTPALYLVIKPLIRSQILKFNHVKKIFFVKKDKLKPNQTNQAEIQLFQRETLAFLTSTFLYFYAGIFNLTANLVKCPFLSHLLCFAHLPGCKKFQFCHPWWRQSFADSKWPEQSYGATRLTGTQQIN